jgi:F-type H+-transporting ATPase subunit delta
MTQPGAARRYAEAAFELATRDGNLDAWRKDLGAACELASDERTARAIDSPAVAFAHRRKALEELLGPTVSKMALNLCLMLARRGRFALMPEISEEFDEMVRHSRGIIGATVTSPSPLSAKDLAAVKVRIEKISGSKVELYTTTDPSMIGGLCIKIGDWQIDASVSTRLERMRKQLVQGTR